MPENQQPQLAETRFFFIFLSKFKYRLNDSKRADLLYSALKLMAVVPTF